MRECIRCKEQKPLSEFNFKIKAKNLRQAHCKDCSRLYVQGHYNKNKQYYLDKARVRNQRIRKIVKKFLWEYLSTNSCVDCGEKDPIVLEFDHIRDKLFNVSVMARNKTLIDVQNEVAKCEVRCANCHRRKTAKQFGWHKEFIMPL